MFVACPIPCWVCLKHARYHAGYVWSMSNAQHHTGLVCACLSKQSAMLDAMQSKGNQECCADHAVITITGRSCHCTCTGKRCDANNDQPQTSSREQAHVRPPAFDPHANEGVQLATLCYLICCQCLLAFSFSVPSRSLPFLQQGGAISTHQAT